MKYYCLGIKGTGMSTLAQILHDLGNEVIGYDDAKEHKFTEIGLEERNIPIYYDGNHILDPETIVTYSAALSEDHPELLRVKMLGLKIDKYCEVMGDVINMFKSIEWFKIKFKDQIPNIKIGNVDNQIQNLIAEDVYTYLIQNDYKFDQDGYLMCLKN